MLNLGQQVIVNINRGRVKSDHHCAGDQADGVDKIQNLKGHETRDQGKNEDPIAHPAKRSVVDRFWAFLFAEDKSIEEIDCCPHWAKTRAEKIAEDEDKEKDRERWNHLPDHLFLCKERNDSDERIKTKVQVDRDSYLQRKGRVEDKVQEKSKRKSLDRSSQVRDHSGHVALTLFTRTFARSISPSPKSKAFLTNRISSGL